MDEYQREVEKETRKLQSDILLAEAKKKLDYEYGIQEYADKAAIDVSKAQTKANINVSEYAQKQAIKEAYGQTTPQNKVETEQINNKDTKISNTFDQMEKAYGRISDTTRPAYEESISDLYREKRISEEEGEKLANMLDYKDIYYTYENMMDERIKMASEKSKDDMKKVMQGWSGKPSAKLEAIKNNFDEAQYNDLLTMVEEKEEELQRILKNKGIDW